ncbi:MAG: GntR family transcriptional regulator [Anaerolineae bacterium]|nr:GntR family transcriptional regulator [Anaerolineae bacterium]
MSIVASAKSSNHTLLSDQVYHLLRDNILGGNFKPGERLDVGAMSAQLGVSQTPVKEALATLAQEGLVEIRARSGTFVAQINMRDMIEVFDIRVALELLAANTLLKNATNEDIDNLNTLIQTIQNATELDVHYRENARFHKYLVTLSGNQRLTALYDQLHAHVHVALVHVVAPGWWRDTQVEAQEHEAIVEAIRKKNKTALNAAITAHLERSRHTLLQQLEAQQERGKGGG